MPTPTKENTMQQALRVATLLDKYADPMEESSPMSSAKTLDSASKQESSKSFSDQDKNSQGEIKVKEEEPLPPSFHWTINEEQLCDVDCPYVFWATICIPIPKNPVDPVAMMFEHLKTFVNNILKADAHFSAFLHNLSKLESIKDLPEPIKDPNQLLDEVKEWLEYFPGACPCARGGYTYTSVLVGLHEPFPKVVKATASWFKFGIWKSSLQSEKPVSLGWLLFSASTMDVKVLSGDISLWLSLIPVGLQWKMISMGAQGSIPKAQQVKALHLYVDELDTTLAKPLLMELYTNKSAPGHAFLLHIQMQLVPEIDSILNTNGRANADQLCACQNMGN